MACYLLPVALPPIAHPVSQSAKHWLAIANPIERIFLCLQGLSLTSSCKLQAATRLTRLLQTNCAWAAAADHRLISYRLAPNPQSSSAFTIGFNERLWWLLLLSRVNQAKKCALCSVASVIGFVYIFHHYSYSKRPAQQLKLMLQTTSIAIEMMPCLLLKPNKSSTGSNLIWLGGWFQGKLSKLHHRNALQLCNKHMKVKWPLSITHLHNIRSF